MFKVKKNLRNKYIYIIIVHLLFALQSDKLDKMTQHGTL